MVVKFLATRNLGEIIPTTESIETEQPSLIQHIYCSSRGEEERVQYSELV